MGFEFQPFELLKISVILLLADQLAKRQKNIDKIDIVPPFTKDVWFGDRMKLWEMLLKDTIPVLGPIVLACCVTLLTSNSTTFIIAISCLAMLFIGRVKMADIRRIITLGFCIGIPALLIFGGRVDTLEGRFNGYSPIMFSKTAEVASDGLEYYKRPAHETAQTLYAKMSIASGGIPGKGPGQSTNRYLQEADKDMAYAFLIEEYGLIFGGLVMLFAFLVMFYRSMVIFLKCGTAFPGLLVLGIGTVIVLQAFLHMLVSVSLFPLTGQQLPIVSKGGTSLVLSLTMLGVLMGVSAKVEE
jgi:cell division protein FtsW